MRKLLLFIFPLISSMYSIAQADSSECSGFRKGFFSYTDSSGNTVLVDRSKNYQFEKNIVTKVKTQSRIKWLSACVYELTLVSSNSKAKRKYKYSTLTVQILNSNADGYQYSCGCPGVSNGSGYLKKLSRKQYYSLY